MSHVQNTHHQYNLPLPKKRIAYRANREGVAEQFTDACASKSIEVDLELIGQLAQVGPVELEIEQLLLREIPLPKGLEILRQALRDATHH